MSPTTEPNNIQAPTSLFSSTPVDTASRPGLIFKKILEVMKGIDFIDKERKNASQGFMFRGIDDIYNALHSKLANVGVFTVPRVQKMERSERKTNSGGTLTYTILTISFRFYAEDGSFVEAVMVGEAMDSGDKSCNKAQAIAHKYAFLQVFSIPTKEDKDPDAETPPPSHPITHEGPSVGAPGPQVNQHNSPPPLGGQGGVNPPLSAQSGPPPQKAAPKATSTATPAMRTHPLPEGVADPLDGPMLPEIRAEILKFIEKNNFPNTLIKERIITVAGHGKKFDQLTERQAQILYANLKKEKTQDPKTKWLKGDKK